MSYRQQRSLLILFDTFLIGLSILLSIRLVSSNWTIELGLSSFFMIVSYYFFAGRYGLYRKAWTYASFGEVLQILKTVTYTFGITALISLFFSSFVLIKAIIVTSMMNLLLIGGSRFVWRLFREQILIEPEDRVNTLIIGAGAAGTMLVRQLQQDACNLVPVAFLDDDDKKQKLEMYNLPVAGRIQDVKEVCEKYEIQHIVIAIPSLQPKKLQAIYETCRQTRIKTQTIPRLEDIAEGKVSVTQLQDVRVEELLGREPVQLNHEGISKQIEGSTVLVTGAGGSIGSEICRQVLQYKPNKLVLLGHGENSIYSIEMELLRQALETEVLTEIADIQDKEKMITVMEKHRPQIVYHAAAHKHVPLMERNPEEAVKNNVMGTRNVVEAAHLNHVSTFVMVSTDKAVNPTSVMGATKRLAEMVVQHFSTFSTTKFVAVRFGNVLGSRGSVIPLFKKQIEEGGPVTVTHPEMVRYFMTIPEASRLVIQAGALAKGGEIFVLDMGEPVKIVDLAKNLIRLSGYTEKDITITFSGIRPGEKLYEELLGKDEVHEQQIYPKIYRGKRAFVTQNFEAWYEGILKQSREGTPEQIRTFLLDTAKEKVKMAL